MRRLFFFPFHAFRFHVLPFLVVLVPPSLPHPHKLIKFQHLTLLLELMLGPWLLEKNETKETEWEGRTWEKFYFRLFFFFVRCLHFLLLVPPPLLNFFLLFSPQGEIFVRCMWRVTKVGHYCLLDMLPFWIVLVLLFSLMRRFHFMTANPWFSLANCGNGIVIRLHD